MRRSDDSSPMSPDRSHSPRSSEGSEIVHPRARVAPLEGYVLPATRKSFVRAVGAGSVSPRPTRVGRRGNKVGVAEVDVQR